MRRIALYCAVVCCVALASVGGAASDVVSNIPSLESYLLALPQGSRLAMIETFGKDGQVLYRQDALFELDLDGDYKPEVVVFYRPPGGGRGADMHLGVIKADAARRGAMPALVADCTVPGTRFGLDRKSRNSVVAVRERDGDAVAIYCATTDGASGGADVVRISVACKDKQFACEAAILARQVEDVSIEKDNLEYSERGQTTPHRVDLNDKKEPASPTSAPAGGARR